jgi:cold shock CspA family protein
MAITVLPMNPYFLRPVIALICVQSDDRKEDKPMPTGKIKWFDRQIGAGFIRSDEGENVFFRFSVIRGDNSDAIRAGQCVSFKVVNQPESISLTAADVKALNS